MNAAIYDVIVNRFQALGQEATRATAEQLQNAQAFGTSQKFVDSLTESLRQQNESWPAMSRRWRARGGRRLGPTLDARAIGARHQQRPAIG